MASLHSLNSKLKNKDLQTALDIGPSFLSELLYPKFGANLWLMGFDSRNSIGGHLASDAIIKKTNFIKQDLNFLEAPKKIGATQFRFEIYFDGKDSLEATTDTIIVTP